MKAIFLAGALLAAGAGQASGQRFGPSDEFLDAWDLITIGGRAQAEVGEWTLENGGAIIAWRRLELVGGKAMVDARIRERVHKRLAEALPRARLEVKVSHGIVSLHGRVGSRQTAGSALWATLRTPGVEEVRSYVSWSEPRRR